MAKDLLERAAWTAAQTFLAVVVAAGTDFVNVATLKAAALAGAAAGLSALKTLLVAKNPLDV